MCGDWRVCQKKRAAFIDHRGSYITGGHPVDWDPNSDWSGVQHQANKATYHENMKHQEYGHHSGARTLHHGIEACQLR